MVEKMLWLNRLQQRLSLTRNEALALLSLSVLLTIGLVARHVQQQAVPVPIGAYDEMDRLFFERSAALESPSDSALTGGSPGEAALARNAASATVRDAESASVREAMPAGGPARIDLNTAGADELQALPRIGPITAKRILTFRAELGPFSAVDDLQQISGIGEKTVELLRPLVYASPAPVDSLAR